MPRLNIYPLFCAWICAAGRVGAMAGGRGGRWLGGWLAVWSLAAGLSAAEVRHDFRVQAGDAVQTLRIFSLQSGEQIVYPIEDVREVRTRSVRGKLTAREALEAMLAGTKLMALVDEASGALAIRRREPAERVAAVEEREARERPRWRWQRRAQEAAEEGEVVVLSPFDVRSRADTGYRAENAVSATRLARPIGELPMSVTAFTEEFIADQKAYDLYDVVKWAPGVHQDNLSPQGWARYNIRGFTSAAIQRNGFASFRFIDTTNIARVEVVKGPASLLYGQINPGGVINYITKKPEARPALRVSASLGDFGYDRQMLDATGPVPGTNGRLLYRGIAMVEDIQRFQTGMRGRKSVLAPSLTWQMTERAALTIDYERFERKEDMLTGGVVLAYVNNVGTVPYRGLPWDFSYAGEGDYQDFVSDALSAEFTTRLGERANLRATFLDAVWDMEWRASGQGGTGLIAQSFIDAFYPASAGLTPADAMYRRNRWEHQWGSERSAAVDLAAQFGGEAVTFDVVLGHKRTFDSRWRGIQKNNPNVADSPFYLKPWDLRNPATWDRRVPFGVDALVLTSDAESASNSSSWFAVVSAKAFDDRLHVLAGYARHALHNEPTRNYVTNTQTLPSDRAANVPQAGAMLEVAKGVSAFVSYSESFLANTSMLRVNNVRSVPASPSVGKGGEAGVKLDLLGGKLSGTLSAYRVRASPTGIVTVTTGVDADGTTLFTDVQGGAQRSDGFEVDLGWAPAPGLKLIAGFSRCDAVYARHPSNPALNGTPLVAAPDRTFSLWGKYVVPAGPLRRFTFAGGVNYVGSLAYVGNNPSVRTGPYATVDVTVGYRFRVAGQEWEADVTVKNVGDERYYASQSSWGFPRHLFLSVGTRF